MSLKILGGLIVFSLVFCLYFIFKKHTKLKNSAQFEGVVVGLEPSRDSDGKTTYALKIEYRDDHAVAHQFTASGASSPPARPIGAKVLVFQPFDGSKPDILVFESIYLALWIWLCVGICITGCFAAPYVLAAIYRK